MRIIVILFGLIGMCVSAVGSLFALMAIIDPVGTKLADDADPFGKPPSRIGSTIFLFTCCLLGLVSIAAVLASILVRRDEEVNLEVR